MAGFVKLFSSIVDSTIWREPNTVRLVWITMLAKADRNGVVEASAPGLADAARVTVEECRAALETLSSPDPDSRTKEHEGRRVREVDGGWLLLNYGKYRDKLSAEERRAYKTLKQREYRRSGQSVDTNSTSGQNGHIADADADADSEACVTRAVEPPAGFPKTEQEAVERGVLAGADEETCKTTWNIAMSRGGLDAKGRPILSWSHHVKAASNMNGHRRVENGLPDTKRAVKERTNKEALLLPLQCNGPARWTLERPPARDHFKREGDYEVCLDAYEQWKKQRMTDFFNK